VIPERIGRYVVDREIDRGGQATVYLAHDPHLGRQVAIKLLPRDLVRDSASRRRFEQEARTIARLEHDAIVAVHDFGEHDGAPYIVMQYMPGGSLESKLRGGPIAVDDCAEILSRVGDAVLHAHNQGVVHRDLKPANILFDAQDRAFVADFGIARLADSTAGLTGTSIIGTPAYMSPEQAEGEPVTAATDAYSLGVIAFEMLAGRPPFVGETVWSVLRKHISEPAPHARTLNPSVSESVAEEVGRLLAKTPTERPTTLARLVAALREEGRPPLAGEAAGAANQDSKVSISTETRLVERDTGPRTQIWSPRFRRRRVKGLALTGGLALAISGALAATLVLALDDGSGAGSAAPESPTPTTPSNASPAPTHTPTQALKSPSPTASRSPSPTWTPTATWTPTPIPPTPTGVAGGPSGGQSPSPQSPTAQPPAPTTQIANPPPEPTPTPTGPQADLRISVTPLSGTVATYPEPRPTDPLTSWQFSVSIFNAGPDADTSVVVEVSVNGEYVYTPLSQTAANARICAGGKVGPVGFGQTESRTFTIDTRGYGAFSVEIFALSCGGEQLTSDPNEANNSVVVHLTVQ
jgi:serine/threonine-protein kinase